MKFSWIPLMALVLCGTAGISRAEIKTEVVKYKAGNVEASGFVAYGDSVGKHPGVLIIPQ